MIQISPGDLKSPRKFKTKLNDYIYSLKEFIVKNYEIIFDEEEIGDLLLSICRINDFNVMHKQKINCS
jgi:hypothetical protein